MANINKVALLNNGKVVGAGRNKDNSNLAPIEATTTASRSYLVGDYLMLQGEFYKVISAIAIGDTLTVGTNIQSTNVGDEVSDINERISANTISESTKIVLTYNTEYTTLTDGYVLAFSNVGAGKYVSIYIDGIPLILNNSTAGAGTRNTVFCKKGTTIKYVGSASTDVTSYFYPLS